MAGERTQQATQHRRDKAREEGDILHSRELTAAAGALAGVMMLGVLWQRFVTTWHTSLGGFLALSAPAHWEESAIEPTLAAIRGWALQTIRPVVAVMAAVVTASFVAALLQTGGVSVHAGAIRFKLERINPAANAAQLFSLRAATRLAKSLVPAGLLGVFAEQRLMREALLPAFSTARLEALGGDAYGLMVAAAWLFFAWSMVDYLVEWRSRETRLKMSREELRQEFKETEGSPQIRSRIRGLQRQMRRRKVREDVSKAAVVVTNPTHYAVALAFDYSVMDAPRVLAKGRNLLAEEIKAEARWAGVPILENPPLARSLYRTVEVGQSIPVTLYAAVASILAYLYRQRVEDERRQRQTRVAAENTPRAAKSVSAAPGGGHVALRKDPL